MKIRMLPTIKIARIRTNANLQPDFNFVAVYRYTFFTLDTLITYIRVYFNSESYSDFLLTIFPRNWNPLVWYSISSSAVGCLPFSFSNSSSRFSMYDLFDRLYFAFKIIFCVVDRRIFLKALLVMSQINCVPGGTFIVHIPQVIQLKNFARHRLIFASPCVKLWASLNGTKWKKIVI